MNEIQRLEMIKASRDLVRQGCLTREDFDLIKKRIICDKPMLFRASLGELKRASDLLDKGTLNRDEYDEIKRQFLCDESLCDFDEILKVWGMFVRKEISEEEFSYLKAVCLSGSRQKIQVDLEKLDSIEKAYRAGVFSDKEYRSLRNTVIKNARAPFAVLMDKMVEMKALQKQGIISESDYEAIRQHLLQDRNVCPPQEMEKLFEYKELLDQGAISQSDYDERKKAIIPEPPGASYEFHENELTIENKHSNTVKPDLRSISRQEDSSVKGKFASKISKKKIIIIAVIAVLIAAGVATIIGTQGEKFSYEGTWVVVEQDGGNNYIGELLILNPDKTFVEYSGDIQIDGTWELEPNGDVKMLMYGSEGLAFTLKLDGERLVHTLLGGDVLYFEKTTTTSNVPDETETTTSTSNSSSEETPITYVDKDSNKIGDEILTSDRYLSLIDSPSYDEAITIKGDVFQDIGDGCYFISSHTEDSGGFAFMVEVPEGSSIEKNDLCIVEGKTNGVYTYTTVSDRENTLPKILATEVTKTTE